MFSSPFKKARVLLENFDWYVRHENCPVYVSFFLYFVEDISDQRIKKKKIQNQIAT